MTTLNFFRKFISFSKIINSNMICFIHHEFIFHCINFLFFFTFFIFVTHFIRTFHLFWIDQIKHTFLLHVSFAHFICFELIKSNIHFCYTYHSHFSFVLNWSNSTYIYFNQFFSHSCHRFIRNFSWYLIQNV